MYDLLLDAIPDRIQTWAPAPKAGGASSSSSSAAAVLMIYGPLIDQECSTTHVVQYRPHRVPDISAEENAFDASFFVPPSDYTHVGRHRSLGNQRDFGPFCPSSRTFHTSMRLSAAPTPSQWPGGKRLFTQLHGWRRRWHRPCTAA
ncbi:hypothetical protein BCR43DRAFT_104461 [Syncephalastrum racemosum]|uniref:Uncharacterized protein n=1 Tax=Syncephalastrum racemosum TaxID=13706 RepID=A0A1X2H1S4_SYNRA|nr:hypothetical protein BCR43DRAFT_104461 [Syncephalastrum racemosum]